jgi:C-terminal processing protease CtpA/Prc
MRRIYYLICALLVVLVLVTLRATTFGQQSAVRTSNIQTHPVNLDFEQGSIGAVPDDWVCPTNGYVAQLTEQQPQSGKHAALLQSQPDANKAAPFGNLMQAIDATPYRGKRVRFKAFVRIEPGATAASAQLWMRVDRAANKIGFFDNMRDRPIRLSEWKEYEIVGDIDDDADVINFGMLLIGQGKAWIDTASFEDLGKFIIRAEAPRPFNGRGLDNLIAFTRLLGYVRHFHPSDEAAATNWDAFSVQGVIEVESAKDANELAQKLDALFRPIAPTIRIFPNEKPPSTQLSMPANLSTLQIVSWRHQGFGPTAAATYNIYHSVRARVPATNRGNSPDPQKPFTTSLGGGVSAIVPLALLADAQGTLPHTAARAMDPKATLVKYSGNDRATRLADVALTWNVLQHFYPYFDVVKTDWSQVLKTTLNAAATDASAESFAVTMRRMMAQLHDGHAQVQYPGQRSGYSAPVMFGWIEGRLVITEIAREGAGGLQPGDVVLKIDGRPALEVINDRESLISGATSRWRRYVALRFLPDGARDSEMILEVQDEAGQQRSVTLRRTIEAGSLTETRPAKLTEIRPGIFYVALDRIKDEDFQKALPELEKAKGIVFDLRGYPTVSPMIISYLIDSPVTSARWMVPIVTTPDHANVVEYETGGRWNLQPIAPRLKAKIAFLTDGRAISYAESYMGIIEAYKLAEIVGEPTAGTNGNINSFTLPGGYTIIFTGMKVLKHDGSQHHGVGINPTVPVSRTIRGVREKRDEQLERAVAIVSQ